MAAAKSALTAAQIEQIRAELLRTVMRLERSLKISGTGERPRDLEQDTVGRLSRIDALQNAGLAKNLEERERIQLKQVGNALQRMEQGTYGACEACGGRIPFERLVVFPETLTCAGCATKP